MFGLIAAAVLIHGAGFPQQLDTTFVAGAGTRLSVESAGGSIAVDTWDGDQIRVRASHGPTDRVRIQRTGSVVRVGGARDVRVPVQYRITVPATLPLELSGGYARIEVEGTRAPVSAQTIDGPITIHGGRERLSLQSVGGRIEVVGATAEVEVTSVSGVVRMRDVSGRIQLQTISGAAVLTGVSSADVSASSVSGPLYFEGAIDPRGRYRFSTHSGAMILALPPDLDATVAFSTLSGTFSTTFGSFTTFGAARGRPQLLTAGSGTAQIELQTFSGNIRIVRPGEIAPPGASGKGTWGRDFAGELARSDGM